MGNYENDISRVSLSDECRTGGRRRQVEPSSRTTAGVTVIPGRVARHPLLSSFHRRVQSETAVANPGTALVCKFLLNVMSGFARRAMNRTTAHGTEPADLPPIG